MSRLTDALRGVIQTVLQPRPVQRMWEWVDEHVVIPLIVGSLFPGALNTKRTPHLRGLFDLYWHRKTRFFTLAKSARVGGTLFSICCVLHKIGVWPGPILWVDPTRKTARRFSRAELQPHVLVCKPAAAQVIMDKKHWTTLEMILRVCTLGIVGAGSASELGGRQAEMVVINEGDKLRNDIKAEAPPAELAIVRSKQFRHTRKIIWNSTPTVETGDTWIRFLAGSQHHCYVPCPKCQQKARITFFPEEKDVPFDRNGKTLGKGKDGKPRARNEKTIWVHFEHCKDGEKYDLERVERESCFKCGHCGKLIEASGLNWMLQRHEWRAHNPLAPVDTISAHTWAAYSPFEHIGTLAKKFLLARGSLSKLHDFYNSDLGLPFRRYASALTPTDIDRIITRSPDYVLGQLPFRPELLTMTVDVQGFGFWWSIRAWGINWDTDGWPTQTALVDYGSAVSWAQIEEFAGLKLTDAGKRHGYVWKNPGSVALPAGEHEETFHVYCGLIDSGFEAQQNKKVYEFCLAHRDVFSPSKGGSAGNLRGKTVTLSPVYDDQLQLVWYFDDHFKQQLYYGCMKEHRAAWYLPRNVGTDYIAQVTAERTVEKKQPNGSVALKWEVVGQDGNHLGDTEKMHEALRDQIEEQFDELRNKRLEEDEERAKAIAKERD